MPFLIVRRELSAPSQAWIVNSIANGAGLPVGLKNFEMKLERIDSSTDPLQRGYDAAWMLATCTVFVALSKVPVTVTF